MTKPVPQHFSDYVVYVDESGDHGLKTMDKTYPLFVLAFCVFMKQVLKTTQQSKLPRSSSELVRRPTACPKWTIRIGNAASEDIF